MEVMKQGSKGEFYLLYVPYPKGKNFEEKQIGEDLHFLASALKLMFYTYGFSAKKTSGFGTIEELKEENIEIYPKDKKGIFSILYTTHNNRVKDGV
jgi:CRISPR-associated protein Cmr2